MPSTKEIIFREAKSYKLGLFFILLLTLLGIGFEAIAPWSFKILIDNVLENEVVNPQSFIGQLLYYFSTKESLGFLAVFIFFASKLLFSIVEYFRSISTKKVIQEIVSQFSRKAFESLETLSIGFYRHQEIGDYLYRLSYDSSAVGDLLEEGILPFIASSLYLFIITLILLSISIKLALFSLITLPFLVLGLYFINKKVVVASKKSEYWNSALFSFIQQALTQLRVIQAFSQEGKELEQFNAKMQSSLKSETKMYNLNILVTLFIGVAIAVIYSLIIVTGITSVFEGSLSAGLLVVFIFYLDNMTYPLLSIIGSYTVIKESRVKIARMNEYFDKQYQVADSGTVSDMRDTTITFKNINLKGKEGKQILENISFPVLEGKITAIVGTSGSGKTTIVSFVPRLIEPTSGKILIGDKELHEYTLKTLRKHIAYVPQEILLFNRSIKEIIGFGKDNATLDEIKEAAKKAAADEFIKRLPNTYDFKVGEHGNYLSSGQRQRLMLARSYIKNAKILLLDEVFSSQDTKTQFTMLENFRKFVVGKTVLIVSNDLEIVSEADYVVVLHNGKIVKSLTHKELLAGKFLRSPNFNQLLLANDERKK